MKKLFIVILAGTLILTLSCHNKKNQEAASTKSETSDNGWVSLFDGSSTKGWRQVNGDSLPSSWEVVDGTLHCKGSGGGEAADTTDILYDKKFSNFHLKLEWKISEGGNSGIFYLGQEVPDWPLWKTAPEYQVLDNAKNPDAMLGKDGDRQAGSLYDLIPAVPQNAKPAGEWNTCDIIVYRGTVIHMQNGDHVVEYHLWTSDWDTLVAHSKFPEYNPRWADIAKEGYIGLQNHGDDVWFRNIMIQEL